MAPALAQVRRTARLPDLIVSVEHEQRKRSFVSASLGAEMKKLELEEVSRKPETWKGKRLRRQAAEENVDERGNAEKAERTRWAKEVLGILHEAQLPLARMVTAVSGSAVEQRCCRGLHAPTLRKHVRVWRPFRRILLAHDAPCFPQTSGRCSSLWRCARRRRRRSPGTRTSAAP